MSNEQLAIALARAQLVGRDRFINIGDISCDIEVSLHRSHYRTPDAT
jgi:hypothetical protein